MPWRRASLQAMRPLPVVIPSRERARACRWPRRDAQLRRRRRLGLAVMEHHRRGRAARQHALQSVRLAAVDGKLVFAAHRDDARGEPASVHRRHPVGCVMGAFAAATATVHLGRCQCEVEKVVREAPPRGAARSAQAAVVRFGNRHDGIDIGLGVGEGAPRVGTVHTPAEAGDNGGLDRPPLGVVAAIVDGTAVLRGDRETAPRPGGRRKRRRADDHREDKGEQRAATQCAHGYLPARGQAVSSVGLR